jgi:tetratricopeptide (TPR) repeat protein
VVVVSDHGEGLGEHGEAGHGFLLHQATIRVPLIVAGPGIPAGLVRRDPISTIDIEASIAASAGLPPATTPREGRLLDWGGAEETDPPAFYSETMRTLLSYGWSHLRALRQDELKLIAGPWDEFFDLSRDPDELAPINPEAPRATAMRSVLGDMVAGDDPEALLTAEDPDPQRLETLASLGYAGGATVPGESRPDGQEYWRPHPSSKLAGWNARQRNRPRYRQAIALLEAGEFEAAVTGLDTFLTVEPRHAAALYNRGLALRQLGRAEDASASIRAALEADPDYVPALRVHSRDLVQRGDFAAALPYLQDLAQLEADDPGAQYNLGVCALKVSRPDLARDALQRFLEVAPPGDQRVPAVRQSLQQLR